MNMPETMPVRIFVDGVELTTRGPAELTLPPTDVVELGPFEIRGTFKHAVPRDLEKLRSVSPAAKKAFARDRVDRFLKQAFERTHGRYGKDPSQ